MVEGTGAQEAGEVAGQERPSVAPVFEASVPSPLEPAESQIELLGRFPWPQPTDANLKVDHRVTEGDPADEIVQLSPFMVSSEREGSAMAISSHANSVTRGL